MVRYNKALNYCIGGVLFTLCIGSLSHFIYGWSGGSIAAALFFPANESVWEHLKMYIFPMTLYSLLGLLYLRGNNNYTAACFLSQFTACLLTIALFYIYTSFAGKSILGVDIVIFILSVLAGYLIAYILLSRAVHYRSLALICSLALIALLTCYFTFTLDAPKGFLFKDLVSGRYGIR
ncbi:MAG: hypothetical protein K2M44_01735 [Clostridia bacterium]|nr:hypothetical protein [Clostridia bacterium]